MMWGLTRHLYTDSAAAAIKKIGTVENAGEVAHFGVKRIGESGNV